MGELVTLQVGGFANFVGSHFWNFQDELLGLAEDSSGDNVFWNSGINLDTLYRIGEMRQGVETYTPRLLALDLRGSLGAVSSRGSLYEKAPCGDSSSIKSWKGPVRTFREDPIPKNKFLQSLDEEQESPSYCNHQSTELLSMDQGFEQDRSYAQVNQKIVQYLEDGVQYWTDYLKAHTHPLSFFEIQGAWQGVTPFQDFGCGRELFADASQAEEFQNRLRFFVEECDHLQGIQAIVDDSGGFSGVASDLLEGLVDDYGKNPVMLFAVRPPSSDLQYSSMKKSVTGMLHDAVSLSKLSSLSHLIVPLEVSDFGRTGLARHLCITESSYFHTSAIYATAISNITLPFRMSTVGPSDLYTTHIGGSDMGSMLGLLKWSSAMKVAELAVALPAPALPDIGGFLDVGQLISLSPFKHRSAEEKHYVEAIVFQGARLMGSKGRASIEDVVNSAFKRNKNSSTSVSLAHLAASLCPLPLPLPFPRFFRASVGCYGDILVNRGAQKGVASDIVSVPVAGRLMSSSAAVPYIREQCDNLQQFGLSQGAVGSSILQQWGFPGEEAYDLKETLLEMIGAFSEHMDTSASDSE